MSFAAHASIFRIGYNDGTNVEWRGTGFICDKVAVSALHVVDVKSPQGLFARFETGHTAPIRNIVADAHGRDLAKFEVAINGLVPIEIMSNDILIGEDVWSWGYPLQEEGGGRYLKGHISRMIQNPFAMNQASYELSFEIAQGISGSPLLLYHNGVKVTGVIYGNGRTEKVDDYVEERVSDSSKVVHISKRIVSYGLAHRLESLKQLLSQ